MRVAGAHRAESKSPKRSISPITGGQLPMIPGGRLPAITVVNWLIGGGQLPGILGGQLPAIRAPARRSRSRARGTGGSWVAIASQASARTRLGKSEPMGIALTCRRALAERAHRGYAGWTHRWGRNFGLRETGHASSPVDECPKGGVGQARREARASRESFRRSSAPARRVPDVSTGLWAREKCG